MNWYRFAMGCGLGLGIVSVSVGIAFLISLNPQLVGGLILLAIVLFIGWVAGAE